MYQYCVDREECGWFGYVYSDTTACEFCPECYDAVLTYDKDTKPNFVSSASHEAEFEESDFEY